MLSSLAGIRLQASHLWPQQSFAAWQVWKDPDELCCALPSDTPGPIDPFRQAYGDTTPVGGHSGFKHGRNWGAAIEPVVLLLSMICDPVSDVTVKESCVWSGDEDGLDVKLTGGRDTHA